MARILRAARLTAGRRCPTAFVMHSPLPPASSRCFSAINSKSNDNLTFQEVLALTSAGEQSMALAESAFVDSKVEGKVREVIDLLKTEGRKPIETFQVAHGPTGSCLSRSLSMAAIAEEQGAGPDDVLAAFLFNAGHLLVDWDPDCPHMANALPMYLDQWLKKIGIRLDIRYMIKLQPEARRYVNALKAGPGKDKDDAEVELFGNDQFASFAVSLVRWSEEAALRQSEFTKQAEDTLIRKCEMLLRSHLLENAYGVPTSAESIGGNYVE